MIKVWIDEGTVKEFSVKGAPDTIGTETCEIVNIIYNAYLKKDKETAKYYKDGMKQFVENEQVFEEVNWEDEAFDFALKTVKDIIGGKNND